MKTVFQTDASGYYVHAAVADIDPLNQGEWLIPGGCVLDAPPPLQNQEAARWTGDAWVVEPDLRGTVYWTQDGQRHTILNMGESLPAGAIMAPPEPTAAQLWAGHQQQAQAALDASDITVLRCVENSVPVPTEWAAYRSSLRAIVRAASGDHTAALPARPAYPAGT